MATILVIEDDAINRMVIEKILADASYKMIEAIDAEAGLTKLKKNPSIKAILLDWMLPGMSGLDALKFIRSSDQFKHIPVIMQTGNSSADDVKRAITAGANDYIVKPIDEAVLLAKLIRAIQATKK